MTKIAVFPGSFDPFTVGHESVVRRALPLFDTIVIAIGSNTLKQSFFTLETRMRMIRDVFSDEEKIQVDKYEGLTVNYCKKRGANYLLRGLRTSADFEFERAIAQLNKSMYPEVESVFLLTLPEHTPINSTIVRDIIRHGGDARKFLPQKMDLKKYL
jgi:pantetheine-phosphate adenylyltransferase